jgi:DNA-directed RNA polymerase specialized sigma24 family protein
MPDTLTALERSWARFESSGRGARLLAHWQGTEPVLAPFATLDALIDAARGADTVDLDHRDDLHLALLRLARTDDDARCAVLHLLHPALSMTARIYTDTWPRDEVSSLVVVAALDIIVRYPDGRPRPAASIIRWVRRAVWKEAQRVHLTGPMARDYAPIDEAAQVASDQRPSSADEVLDLVRIGLASGVLDKPKARLIVLHRILGVPTAVIAQREGYPASTIRQRRSRAEAAIATLARRVA